MFRLTALGPTALSKIVFSANVLLWNILAMVFNAHSRIYLRSSHDPVGLLVLQGGIGA